MTEKIVPHDQLDTLPPWLQARDERAAALLSSIAHSVDPTGTLGEATDAMIEKAWQKELMDDEGGLPIIPEI